MTAIAKLARITRSRQEWAESITSTWQRAVTHAVQVIILTGQEIDDAKEALGHGEFILMVENDLPFDRTTAFRLMKVAQDQRLSNVARGQHLPPSWRTLYELTKVSDAQLEKGFESGVIHPAMERKDVALLRGKVRKPRRKKTSSPIAEAIGPVALCAMELRRQLFEALSDMDAADRKALFARVREEIDDLEKKNLGG